jgi:hypothetical protein
LSTETLNHHLPCHAQKGRRKKKKVQTLKTHHLPMHKKRGEKKNRRKGGNPKKRTKKEAEIRQLRERQKTLKTGRNPAESLKP